VVVLLSFLNPAKFPHLLRLNTNGRDVVGTALEAYKHCAELLGNKATRGEPKKPPPIPIHR